MLILTAKDLAKHIADGTKWRCTRLPQTRLRAANVDARLGAQGVAAWSQSCRAQILEQCFEAYCCCYC